MQKVGVQMLLSVLLLWKLSFSSSTEGQAQHARGGDWRQSHLGCRPVWNSWVTSFLLSATLVLVPAAERVKREPSSHTYIFARLCSCLFSALRAFLHGHLAGELPVWCQRQVQASGTEQDNCIFHWEQESGKGFCVYLGILWSKGFQTASTKGLLSCWWKITSICNQFASISLGYCAVLI